MKIFKNIYKQLISDRSLIILFIYIVIAIIAFLVDSDQLASVTDVNNIYKAPLENQNYLLGTDGLGRSVAYGLLNGTKIAILISIASSICSLIIGLFFGFLAAYYGDNKLKIQWTFVPFFILVNLISGFYLIYTDEKIYWALTCLTFNVILILLSRKTNFYKISIPIDTIIIKFLELLKTLPGIFIVLFFLSLFATRSVWTLILIITIVRSPIIIRLGRSEILKIKSQQYFIAAEGMGLKLKSMLSNYILPNILTPIKTYLAYGLASTVQIEAILSFIGLGLPIETVTWGSMISSSRQFFNAWWLAVLPGLAIFYLIYALRKYFSRRSEAHSYFYI